MLDGRVADGGVADGVTGGNVVSGQVQGAVVQAGVVHGGVHVHTVAPGLTACPRQVPAPPATLVGREAELARLDAEYAQRRDHPGPCVLVLSGAGGVGKTALALKWVAPMLGQFGDGQLFAEGRLPDQDEPALVEDIVAGFLRALGVAAGDVPTGLAQRSALFRTVTARRAVLVVLDDAVSAAQVQALLPASAASAVVVTSRKPLLGLHALDASMLAIARLADADALALLRRVLGAARVDAEPDAAAQIVAHCDGFPIALQVVAARLAARPERDMWRSASDLADEQRRLDVLSMDEDLSARAALQVSYHDLPPTAALAYRVLGLHPGNVVSAELLTCAAGISVPAARGELDTLVDFHLLEPRGEEYTMHDLVRLHAKECATTDVSSVDNENAVWAMLVWYLAVATRVGATVMPWRTATRAQAPGRTDDSVPLPAGIHDPGVARGWFAAHHPDLMAALRATVDSGWHAMTCRLVAALEPMFILHKHDHDAVEAYAHGLAAAQALGDWDAERAMHGRLPRSYARIGETGTATRLAREAFAACAAHEDRRGMASAWKTRGHIAVRAGDAGQAVHAFEQCLSLLDGSGRARSEGLCLIELAGAYRNLGQLPQAIAVLQRAQDILGGLAVPDTYSAARAATRHAEVLLDMGEVSAALPVLRSAATELRETGAPYDAALAYRALATALERSGDPVAGRGHAATAEALLAEAGRAEHPTGTQRGD